MTVSKQQPMRPAEIDLIDQTNKNTSDIAANKSAIANEVTDRKNAVDAEKNARVAADNTLQATVQDQLEFLKTVPALEFGTSNAIDVPANSNTRVDINYSRKTEIPIVLCGLQHASGNLNCIVTGATNEQFSVTVYNLTSTDVQGVTIDWLAISGR